MKQNHIGRRICSLMLSAVLVLQGGVYTPAEEVVTENDPGYTFSAAEELGVSEEELVTISFESITLTHSSSVLLAGQFSLAMSDFAVVRSTTGSSLTSPQ